MRQTCENEINDWRRRYDDFLDGKEPKDRTQHIHSDAGQHVSQQSLSSTQYRNHANSSVNPAGRVVERAVGIADVDKRQPPEPADPLKASLQSPQEARLDH